MKFNKIAPYIFLLLIAFAQIADTSYVTKIARRRLQNLSKSKSKAKSTRTASTTTNDYTILTETPDKIALFNADEDRLFVEVKLSESVKMGPIYKKAQDTDTTSIIKSIKNLISNKMFSGLINFIMGVLCNFFSPICQIWETITSLGKNITEIYKCIKQVTTIESAITPAAERAMESIQRQGSNDRELCTTIQADLARINPQFLVNDHQFPEFASTPQESVIAKCSTYNEETIRNLKFTPAQYIEQCEYFADKDCTTFAPSLKNITTFMKSAKGIFDTIWSTKDCIISALKLIPGLGDLINGLIEEVVTWAAKAAASVLGSVALSFLTCGIWAGVKAAYYIIKLGIQIYKVIQKYRETRKYDWFAIGKIVGNAVDIVKSFIGMRRRRFMKLKK